MEGGSGRATALQREEMDSRLRGNKVLQGWMVRLRVFDVSGEWVPAYVLRQAQGERRGEYPHLSPLPGRERGKEGLWLGARFLDSASLRSE